MALDRQRTALLRILHWWWREEKGSPWFLPSLGPFFSRAERLNDNLICCECWQHNMEKGNLQTRRITWKLVKLYILFCLVHFHDWGALFQLWGLRLLWGGFEASLYSKRFNRCIWILWDKRLQQTHRAKTWQIGFDIKFKMCVHRKEK